MQLQPKPFDPLFSRAGILREEPNRRHRDFGVSTATSAARILHSQALAVVMASTVVKRIPLIRFPARMKSPAPPASATASASSPLGAEPKTPPTPDVAGASRPHHSSVPSQKVGGVA